MIPKEYAGYIREGIDWLELCVYNIVCMKIKGSPEKDQRVDWRQLGGRNFSFPVPCPFHFPSPTLRVNPPRAKDEEIWHFSSFSYLSLYIYLFICLFLNWHDLRQEMVRCNGERIMLIFGNDKNKHEDWTVSYLSDTVLNIIHELFDNYFIQYSLSQYHNFFYFTNEAAEDRLENIFPWLYSYWIFFFFKLWMLAILFC